MSSPTLTRRALIAGAGTAIASAALAVPTLNAVRADEMCNLPVETAAERIGRLVFELSTALDEEYGGEFEAVIGPDGAASYRWVNPSPKQRVEEHQKQLRAALADQHGVTGWRVMATSERGIEGPVEFFAA